MKITSNTILITGGSSGIGFELARQLLALGNEVIITGRDAAKLERAHDQLKGIHTLQSDVSDAEAIRILHERVTTDFPKLNILINNAGIMRRLNLHKANDDLVREIEINLMGPVRMNEAFLPHLKAQPQSAIVNVSSGLAYVPLPLSPIYCATKAALHSYSQSLRVQLKKTNVRVFELAPPGTQTPIMDAFDASEFGGAPMMDVSKMVKQAIAGFAKDNYEITPGLAKALRLLARIAPQTALAFFNKSVAAMVAEN